MNRIKWVDFAKTLAIYAVLVIHTHCDVGVAKICNAVALPLFFFISGYLFSFERHKEFRPFLYKRFRQLIIPYIWINIVAYLFWFFIGRKYGEDAASPLSWHEPLIGIVLGIGPKLAHDIPLWSLLSFFVVEMIYYLAYRLVPRNGLWFLVFVLAAWLMGEYSDYTQALPLTLGPVMAGLCFYILGHSCRINRIMDRLPKHGGIICIASLGIFIFCSEVNSKVNFYICQYGNFILFLISALTGITGIVLLCKSIGKWLGECKMINLISTGTLLICGFHLMVYSMMKGFGYFILHIQPYDMTAGPLRGLVFALAGLFLCIPIVLFIEKYLRVLTDK